MDLDSFISETLSHILRGVQGAIEATKDTKGVINPVWGDEGDIREKHIRDITFDIAVTVADRKSSSHGGGIKVLAAELGAEGVKERESSRVSRIQFTLPLIPPVQLVKRSRRGGKPS
jgi:hypothetical protein